MLSVAVAFAAVMAAPRSTGVPPRGKFGVEHHNVLIGGFTSGIDQMGDIYFPADAGNASFPVLSFAHGVYEGGPATDADFSDMLSQVASHGFFVVAPNACTYTCFLELFAADQMHAIDVVKKAKNPVLGPSSSEAWEYSPRTLYSDRLCCALRSSSRLPQPQLALGSSAIRGAQWPPLSTPNPHGPTSRPPFRCTRALPLKVAHHRSSGSLRSTGRLLWPPAPSTRSASGVEWRIITIVSRRQRNSISTLTLPRTWSQQIFSLNDTTHGYVHIAAGVVTAAAAATAAAA